MVLDTSVLVSGLLSSTGAAAEVLEHILRGTLFVLFDERILGEYREVFARPEFAVINGEDLESVLFVLTQGGQVRCTPYPGTLKDEKDRPFIEVAISGKADLILTFNPKDFMEPPGLPVMKPGQWAQLVAHWLTSPNPEGTTMEAMACTKCGTIRLWRVTGLEVPTEPEQLPFGCAQPTSGGQCGGVLWGYPDTDDGRARACAQGLPVRRV